MNTRSVYAGILLALIGYTAFAICDVCIKWLTQHYSIYQVIVADTGLAALFILIFSRFLGGTKDLRNPKNLKVHSARIALNFIICLIVTSGLKTLPIANVYTLIFTIPFFAAILSIPMYGEKVTGSRWIAIIFGFCGVVIALKPGFGSFDLLLLLVLVSAFLIALFYILARSAPDASIFSLSFLPSIGVATLIFPLMLMDFTWVHGTHIPIFLLAGTVSGIGMICVSHAFRIAPASVVSPFLYTEMIWALIFGYFLFNDTPDIFMLLGAMIIIMSGIYLIETERRNVA
jgi:drug/metabolite transporter (DMT)-like permease